MDSSAHREGLTTAPLRVVGTTVVASEWALPAFLEPVLREGDRWYVMGPDGATVEESERWIRERADSEELVLFAEDWPLVAGWELWRLSADRVVYLPPAEVQAHLAALAGAAKRRAIIELEHGSREEAERLLSTAARALPRDPFALLALEAILDSEPDVMAEGLSALDEELGRFSVAELQTAVVGALAADLAPLVARVDRSRRARMHVPRLWRIYPPAAASRPSGLFEQLRQNFCRMADRV